MSDELQRLKSFNFQDATVHVWIFKSRPDAHDKNIPRYTGRWIESGENLDEGLKRVAHQEVNRVTEVIPYDILAQNNEGSALTIPYEETHVGLIVDACAEQTDTNKIKKIQHMENAIFYVVKYIKNGECVFGIKKTPAEWKNVKRRDFFSIHFSVDELEVVESDTFSMQKSFDVLVHEDTVFALDKTKCESVLNYKQAHIQNFSQLTEDEDFVSLFDDLEPISRYVGTNKIQLRRAAAIQQKGYFRDKNFIASLVGNKDRLRLAIDVDDNGKIVATEESCRDIFQALLDHRLMSHYQDKVYDVPATVDV